MRLMELSRSSVDVHLDRMSRGGRAEGDPITKILSLIRDLSLAIDADASGVRSVPMDLIREQIRGRGFSDEHLQHSLIAFDQCNIWSVSPDGTTLKIFN